MEKMIDVMEEGLRLKRKELKDKQEEFEVEWNKRKDSACFERHAITNLLIMQKIKSEIEELERWVTFVNTHSYMVK